MEWTIEFSSTTVNALIPILGAIIAASVTWKVAAKRFVIENITQERAKWRETIRAKAMLVHDAMINRKEKDLNRHRNEFRALLNPFDYEDRRIIRCIALPKQDGELVQAEEFAKRIAFLLKHDWERAKYESRILRLFRCEPKRKSF